MNVVQMLTVAVYAVGTLFLTAGSCLAWREERRIKRERESLTAYHQASE